MTVQQKLYTAAEFWALTDQLDANRQYELINGEIIAKEEPDSVPPSSKRNAIIAAYLVRILGNYVAENGIEGYVLGPDGGYTLSEHNVRVPDVSFIFKERLPDPQNTIDIIAPDMAVEVISPSETPRLINAKNQLYLDAGTSLVWNVYPQEQIVEVWTQGDRGVLQMRALTTADTLTGGDVLPGFALSVKTIFEQIPS